MNAKRIKYTTLDSTTVKEEMVPVIIQTDSDNGDTEYTYHTFATEEEAEAAATAHMVALEHDPHHHHHHHHHHQQQQQQHHHQRHHQQHPDDDHDDILDDEVVTEVDDDGIVDEEIDEEIDGEIEDIVDDDDEEQHALANAQEVIIDQNGQPVTLQQIIENGTVEEVETVEEGDGTHTILHIVPTLHHHHHHHHQEHGDEDDEHIVGDETIVEGVCVTTDDEIDGETITTIYESPIGVNDGIHITDDLHPNPESPGRSKNFFCPNCGNCYSAAGSLKLHMRACTRQRTEVPAEDRRCRFCNKVFNSVTYLKEHMLRHTGGQPFRCTRCYRKFIDENKYKSHMEAHKHQDRLEAEAEALASKHGGRKVVVKEFNCSFCAENFTVVFEVGQVKRRYACDSCREKYSNEEALRKHKAMVEEKREFNCDRCGRKFVFEGFLQRHLPTCDGSVKRRRDVK